MGKVTIVGSYIVALVIDADRIPQEGETLVGTNFRTIHGGKGSNMAACAARLGATSTFIGKVGKDAYGEGFISRLSKEGVDSGHVLFSETLPTAVGMIVCSTKGTNAIVIDLGPNAEFLPQDLASRAEVIKSSDVVVSPLEIPLETALEGARIAKAKDVKAILNPAPAQNLKEHDLRAIFALTPNETEGRICLGLSPDDQIGNEELAERLVGLGPENVMMTLGESGVIWASKSGIEKIPALKVDVVDSVGAGDAFNAGLAVGLSENRPLQEAIQIGVKAASLSVTKRGTIESYPYREQLR